MANWFGGRERGDWRSRHCGEWNECTDAECECVLRAEREQEENDE